MVKQNQNDSWFMSRLFIKVLFLKVDTWLKNGTSTNQGYRIIWTPYFFIKKNEQFRFFSKMTDFEFPPNDHGPFMVCSTRAMDRSDQILTKSSFRVKISQNLCFGFSKISILKISLKWIWHLKMFFFCFLNLLLIWNNECYMLGYKGTRWQAANWLSRPILLTSATNQLASGGV